MAATTPVKSISLPPTLPNPACTHADIVNSFDEKSIFMNCIAVRKPVPFFHTFSPEFMVVCLKPFLDKMLFIKYNPISREPVNKGKSRVYTGKDGDFTTNLLLFKSLAIMNM